MTGDKKSETVLKKTIKSNLTYVKAVQPEIKNSNSNLKMS